MLQNNPQAQQAIDEAVNKLQQDSDVTTQSVDQMINMFEFVLQNPDSYGKLRKQAIDAGQLDEGDLPPDYDESVVTLMLLTLRVLKQRMSADDAGGKPGEMQQDQGMQSQMQPQMPQQSMQGAPPAPSISTEINPQLGFARGGLAQVADAGRRGDTQLAHINPFEADLLMAYGGSGTINPKTGLPEFGFLSGLWKGIKSVAKTVLPVAATFFAPYLAPFLGGSMLAAGAVAGGLGSALTGGNVLKGAALGGLGGGLGSLVGGAANTALGTGLSQSAQSILGGGLVGGAVGAATGQGALRGAATGAIGQYLGGQLGAMGASQGGNLGSGISAGGAQFGNMLTAGYDPKQAAIGGGLSGLAAGFASPSKSVIDSYQNPIQGVNADGLAISSPQNQNYGLSSNVSTLPQGYGEVELGSGLRAPGVPSPAAGMLQAPVKPGFGFNTDTAFKALPLVGLLSSVAGKEQPQEAVRKLSPQQQEYFNRPSTTYDWNRMQQDADSAGLGLGNFMAQNWNQVSSGAYNQPVTPIKMARDGLSQLAYAVGGAGSGREDLIDAKLSDGEYVMDAETVAMLGDGSGKEGAKRLDEMRANLRAHKGKNLSKGKISPDAKSPLAYMKGSM